MSIGRDAFSSGHCETDELVSSRLLQILFLGSNSNVICARLGFPNKWRRCLRNDWKDEIWRKCINIRGTFTSIFFFFFFADVLLLYFKVLSSWFIRYCYYYSSELYKIDIRKSISSELLKLNCLLLKKKKKNEKSRISARSCILKRSTVLRLRNWESAWVTSATHITRTISYLSSLLVIITNNSYRSTFSIVALENRNTLYIPRWIITIFQTIFHI